MECFFSLDHPNRLFVLFGGKNITDSGKQLCPGPLRWKLALGYSWLMPEAVWAALSISPSGALCTILAALQLPPGLRCSQLYGWPPPQDVTWGKCEFNEIGFSLSLNLLFLILYQELCSFEDPHFRLRNYMTFYTLIAAY